MTHTHAHTHTHTTHTRTHTHTHTHYTHTHAHHTHTHTHTHTHAHTHYTRTHDNSTYWLLVSRFSNSLFSASCLSWAFVFSRSLTLFSASLAYNRWMTTHTTHPTHTPHTHTPHPTHHTPPTHTPHTPHTHTHLQLQSGLLYLGVQLSGFLQNFLIDEWMNEEEVHTDTGNTVSHLLWLHHGPGMHTASVGVHCALFAEPVQLVLSHLQV